VVGFSEHDNESSNFINGGEILKRLNGFLFLKKAPSVAYLTASLAIAEMLEECSSWNSCYPQDAIMDSCDVHCAI
jgi:hypothetical protein